MLFRAKLLVRSLQRILKTGYGGHYFSQQGEDMVVNSLLLDQRNGFYVDVGAHHPFRYSNTAFFYERGWRGINIDPNPEAIAEFRRWRPKDINLNMGVAAEEGEPLYYRFSDPAVNTFSKADAERCQISHGFKLIGQEPVKTLPLKRILAEHLPEGQEIDLLPVDVEGLDEVVLRSNDWTLFRPRLVLAEDLNSLPFSTVLNSSVTRFMETIGYSPIAKTAHTVVYAETNRIKNEPATLVS